MAILPVYSSTAKAQETGYIQRNTRGSREKTKSKKENSGFNFKKAIRVLISGIPFVYIAGDDIAEILNSKVCRIGFLDILENFVKDGEHILMSLFTFCYFITSII